MTVGIPDFYFNFAHNLLALTFLVNFALVYMLNVLLKGKMGTI